MSVRYGISLIPDPVFTARVYRVRQLVCGQYGSWAAEMHLLHLTLADYFQCTDAALPVVAAGLTQLAQRCRQRSSRFPVLSRGVSTFAGTNANIHLDFSASANPGDRHQEELSTLHQDVIKLLEQTEGALPDLSFTGENYIPHITLMQQADLPPAVFASAVDYAQALLKDLNVPHGSKAWQMVLVRFESDAAGDDWKDGRWAADLRWQLVDSYPL